ncbi:oxidoreductase [Ilyonectria robusta]
MSSSAAAKRLTGKTIVVTGASSGIGRSTALEFARTAPQNGLRLILTARRIDTLKELAAEITKEVGEGVKVLPFKLDVSSSAEVKAFVGNLPEEWRNIDVLVNNAGLVKGVARAPEIDEDDINVMFQTNVTGLVNMTQVVLPIFLARPDGGHGDIINVGSIAGREPYAGGSIYCATKAAVRSFSESLRKELIASRVRVIEVDPGQVETVTSTIPQPIFCLPSLTLVPRSSPLSASMATSPRLMLSTHKECESCTHTKHRIRGNVKSPHDPTKCILQHHTSQRTQKMTKGHGILPIKGQLHSLEITSTQHHPPAVMCST